jgi:4'-phosphopantetheinyl transferase
MVNVHLLQQTDADLPAGNDWLSDNEALRLNTFRLLKRRGDWVLGRWTAKRAVCAYTQLTVTARSLACIEIRPAPSGAPEVFIANKLAPVAISLSHRSGVAVCALGAAGIELGCDVEVVEPRCDAFVSDFFTRGEQELIAKGSVDERARVATLLWSAKESVLKALRTGLRIDTREVAITGEVGAQWNGEIWRPVCGRYNGSRSFYGWWRQTGRLVWTVMASPPPLQPIEAVASPGLR